MQISSKEPLSGPKPLFLNCLILLIPILILILFKWQFLVSGELMASIDTYNNFTLFTYYINNFKGGVPPLWSPLHLSGEPFYYYIFYYGLTNPAFLISMIIHKIFPTIPFIKVFHIHMFFNFLIFYFGMAALIFKLSFSSGVRFLVLLAVALGTLSYTLYHNPFILYLVIYVPWFLYFLLQVVEGKKAALVLCGVCVVAQIANYIPSYFAVYVAFLFLGAGVEYFFSHLHFNLKKHIESFRSVFPLKYCLLSILVISSAVPAFHTLYEDNKTLHAVARAKDGTQVGDSGIEANFNGKDTGSTASYSDYFVFSRFEKFAEVGESPLLLGGVLHVFAILGFLFGSGRGRITIIISTILLQLLSFGVNGGISPLLFKHAPFFSFIRSLSPFIGYVFINYVLLALYFLRDIHIERFSKGSIDSFFKFGMICIFSSGIMTEIYARLNGFHYRKYVILVLCLLTAIVGLWWGYLPGIFSRGFKKGMDSGIKILNPMTVKGFLFKKHGWQVILLFVFLLYLYLSRLQKSDHYLYSFGPGAWPSVNLLFILGVIYLLLNKRIKELLFLGSILVIFDSYSTHNLCDDKWTESTRWRTVHGENVENWGRGDKCYNAALTAPIFKTYEPPKYTYNPRRLWRASDVKITDYRTVPNPFLSGFGFSYLFNLEEAYPADFTFVLSQPYLKLLNENILNFEISKNIEDTRVSEKLKDILGISSDKLILEPSTKNSFVQVADFSSNRIVLKAKTDEPSTLIYKDGFHPYWRAKVNGAEVPVLDWFQLFKKVEVPKGESVIEFNFLPMGFLLSFYFIVFCSIFTLLWGFLEMKQLIKDTDVGSSSKAIF